MSDNILLIALDDDAISEVRWGKVGEVQSSVATALDLDNVSEDLLMMAQSSMVVVVVPARHVVLRSVAFQGKQRLATPLALAYQYENDLLMDVEQMHWVVLGKEQTNYGIAGVALTQMTIWMERLSSSGIRVDKMIPDVLALPLPGQCSAIYWVDRWLIRTGKWQGMQLPGIWIRDDELPMKPDLCIHADGCLPATVENIASEVDPLWLLAGEAWHSKSNLLQGKFKPVLKWPSFMPGKAACVLLLTGCSLLLCGLYHQLMARQSEQQTVALYQRLLPGQPLTPSPVETVRSKIRQMQDLLNKPQLFKLLPYAAEALSLWQPPQLQSLIFDSFKNELVITLLKNDVVLVPPKKDNGIAISMADGEVDNLVILTIRGKQ